MECQLERFAEFLRQNKYSESTIKAYLKELKVIHQFDFTATEEDCVVFINKTIKDAEKQGISKSYINNLRAALHQLFLMTFGKTVKVYCLQNRSRDYIDLFLDGFFSYSTKFKSQITSTASADMNHIRDFLNYIGFDASYDFSQLRANDVIGFINDSYTTLKPSSRGRYITSIRNFFRFLEYKNIPISKEILELPLAVPDWKGRKVPTVLNEEEKARLKNHFSQDEEAGLRNHLIIILMLDYGLRCSEIPQITINDIQWSMNNIIIKKTKTHNDRYIPLNQNFLMLLEKYIVKFRNNSSKYLFTTVNQRKKNLKMNTEEVRRIVRLAFKKENIHGYWKGTHSLRRSAASHLFNNTNSFKVVSDILGHKSIESTTSYVRVDFELLRSIASPWPRNGGEVND